MRKLIYILVFFIAGLSYGQTKKQLERERRKLKKDIKKIEKILSETKNEKANALESLKDYTDKVHVREKLVKTINLEIKKCAKDIEKNEYLISKYEIELKKLKEDYAKMVYQSYKSKSNKSKALFIMSSKDFHQAYKRLKYINELKKFKKNQALSIIDKQHLIESLNDSLRHIQTQKTKLYSEQLTEKKKIVLEKIKKEQLLKNIKQNESKYLKQLNARIERDKRIEAEINKILAAATKRELTPSELLLKESFEKNKGRLPSPVNNGYITRRYGRQNHPTQKNIKINCPGIRIRCEKNSTVRAVFKGKVIAIATSIKGVKSVYIQHGDYITSYVNLDKIYVKKGDNIKIGQRLGRVFTNRISGKTILQFVLAKKTKTLDPQKWINI